MTSGLRATPRSRHIDLQIGEAIDNRVRALDIARQFLNGSFPERLRMRTGLSVLWTDEWATAETRKQIENIARELEKTGDDWLKSLPFQPVIDLGNRPVVLLLDALPPDVWMEARESCGHIVKGARQDWFRICSDPRHRVINCGALWVC